MNFLNGVFAPEEFEERIAGIAREMARTVSPQAALETKRQLYAELMESDVGACIEDSKHRIGKAMHQRDFKEGVAAMAERREPRFQGVGKGDQ
jgi:enoyl-CoA hydratase/carnithine racemase